MGRATTAAVAAALSTAAALLGAAPPAAGAVTDLQVVPVCTPGRSGQVVLFTQDGSVHRLKTTYAEPVAVPGERGPVAIPLDPPVQDFETVSLLGVSGTVVATAPVGYLRCDWWSDRAQYAEEVGPRPR